MKQREAAITYAQSLSTTSPDSEIVELEEGLEDDMFWMLVGTDDYASADYWRWKKDAIVDVVDPRIWRIQGGGESALIVSRDKGKWTRSNSFGLAA